MRNNERELAHDDSLVPTSSGKRTPRRVKLASWILCCVSILSFFCLPGAAQDSKDHKKKLWDLQPKIDRAIDTGVEYLLSRQQRDGSWAFLQDQFPNGQTALAVYTLLKCDFPPNHPAVVRGLAFLDQTEPKETYSLACQVMALQASGAPGSKAKIAKLVKTLLKWQEKGAWGYPEWRTDLSNTQYGALALRAAHHAGIKVSKKTVSAMIKAALNSQEKAKTISLPAPPDGVNPKASRDSYGKTPSGLEYDRSGRSGKVAGFFYEKGSVRQPTGSMTTAGLGVLLICNQIMAGKMSGTMRTRMSSAVRSGLNWFRKNWAVDKNPGMAARHHYYYLYGLERVGSLLQEEILADHPWYFEGAKWLVSNQGGDGSWLDQEGNPFLPPNNTVRYHEHVTCFALLFLKRATRSSGSTGDKKERRGFKTYEAVATEYPVSLRGTGAATLSIWVSGFGKKVIAEHEGSGGIRVTKVQYFVDGSLVETIVGDSQKPWKFEKYPLKYAFKKPGKFKVTAKVFIRAATATDKEERPLVVLEAPGFTAEIDAVVQEWMISDAKARGRNLLHPLTKREPLNPMDAPKKAPKKRRYQVTSSSRRQGDEGGVNAFDGRQSSRWICQDGDALPSVMIKISKSIKTTSVRLSQACRNGSEAKDFDRITEVVLEINGSKEPISLTLNENVLASTIYTFPGPTKIKSLRVRVIGRRPSTINPGCAGFTEIALEGGK